MKRSPMPRRKAWMQRRTELRRQTAAQRVDRDYQAAREAVKERSGGRCEAGIAPVCSGTGRHAHHVLRRSQGGPDTVDNLLWLCPPCHSWTHDNPAEAMARGLLRRRTA